MSKAKIQLINDETVNIEGFSAWEADQVKIQFYIPRDEGKEVQAFPMQSVLSYSVTE